jgi:hypothetical protein
MTKLKVVMDSGKEYEIETTHDVQDFVNSLYSEVRSPVDDSSNYVMKSTFMYLDDDHKIMFSPIHVSSIEIIE